MSKTCQSQNAIRKQGIVRVGSWCAFFLAFALSFFTRQVTYAKEKRFALLIGHQGGWKGDTRLTYAISGDLLPLGKALRNIGFQVKTLTNPSTAQLRRALQRTKKKLQKDSTIKTFFFYYTGHADARFLHVGKRSKRAIRYQELASFFRGIPTVRRIAVFDACYSGAILREFGSFKNYKRLQDRGKSKGFRRRHHVDLRKLLKPKQGYEEGLRVIASSLGLSWELKDYKASIFTHHLLKGMRGPADHNQDGKITIDELFDYTSQQVKKDSGQLPQQFILLRRSTPYAFAPAYRSRLLIPAETTGYIRVDIANFVWTKNKRKRSPLHLAVVDGAGEVYLKKGNRCWKQSLSFPKNGKVTLGTSWSSILCRRLVSRRKGQLHLKAQKAIFPKKPFHVSLGLAPHYTSTHHTSLQSLHWGANLSTHLGKYFETTFFFHTGQPTNKNFRLTALSLQQSVGFLWAFMRHDSHHLECYAAVYLGAGILLQQDTANTLTIATFQTGARLRLTWWFRELFGLFLAPQLGLHYIPTSLQNQSPASLQWHIALGLRYML